MRLSNQYFVPISWWIIYDWMKLHHMLVKSIYTKIKHRQQLKFLDVKLVKYTTKYKAEDVGGTTCFMVFVGRTINGKLGLCPIYWSWENWMLVPFHHNASWLDEAIWVACYKCTDWLIVWAVCLYREPLSLVEVILGHSPLRCAACQSQDGITPYTYNMKLRCCCCLWVAIELVVSFYYQEHPEISKIFSILKPGRQP